jgi:hypothetical protein
MGQKNNRGPKSTLSIEKEVMSQDEESPVKRKKSAGMMEEVMKNDDSKMLSEAEPMSVENEENAEKAVE